jgi:DNA-binding CsgD family transcriptional regulator/signal transduction histidine kinase
MRGLRERVAGLDRAHVDAIFAVAVIIELELECWLNQGIPGSPRLATAVAAVFFAAPIAVRRYVPSLALLFCLAVVVIQTPLGGYLLQGSLTGDLVPVLVLAYSAGAWLNSRRSVLTSVLGIGLLLSSALLPVDGGPTGVGGAASGLFWITLMIIPAWFVGRLVRERHRRATAFGELATRAAAEQEQRESVAITEERARIGGELRGTIAYSVSAMMIQAGAAGRLLRSDPDRVRDSILNVEQTGREALADLRRLLGVLRNNDDPRELAPQPGLDQIASLAGASGFLLKDVAPEQLIAGIHIIAQGDSLLSPTVTRRLIESFVRHHRTPQPPPGIEDLTARELQILELVARGLSNNEIAEQLVVSSSTIKTHVARVLLKLGVRDRVQAVVLAYETGVISPGPSNSSPSPRARQEHHHRRMTCGLCSSLDADVLRRRRSMRNSDAPTRRDSRAAVSQCDKERQPRRRRAGLLNGRNAAARRTTERRGLTRTHGTLIRNSADLPSRPRWRSART